VREHIITKKKGVALSVEFWKDLGQKGVEGNPKVAIVPFLYFNS